MVAGRISPAASPRLPGSRARDDIRGVNVSDHPPRDITPARPDGARRLTYAELAAVRGISRASAERLVRRKHWPRQIGNDGVVRVLVPPEDAAPESTGNGAHRSPGHPPLKTAPDSTPANASDIMAVIRDVISPLAMQLERECKRVDRAERKVDQLETALADALAAERIAAGEAAALRAEADQRRGWSLRRRLWWAIRPRRS